MTRPKSKRQIRGETVAVPPLDFDRPTPERLRQDEVLLVRERDPDGATVTHMKIADTLVRMERAGLLEASWVAAGNRFRRDFCEAQLSPLLAADLRRQRGAGGIQITSARAEEARERLWAAMRHVGGMASPAGSILWNVVGAETTVHQWVARQVIGTGRHLRHEVATGILIAALSALAGYYAQQRRHNAGTKA